MSEEDIEFEALGTKLLDLLEHDELNICFSFLRNSVQSWACNYNRAEKLHEVDGCNRTHVLGASLCVLLHKCTDFDMETYNLSMSLGAARDRVIMCAKEFAKYDLEDILSLVTALQLEFESLYTLRGSTTLNDCEAGYWAVVNIEDICLRVMAQLGSCLAIQHKLPIPDCPTAESASTSENKTKGAPEVNIIDVPSGVVRGLLEVDSAGFCSPRMDTVVGILDALHSIFSLHTLLTRATYVPSDVLEKELEKENTAEVHAHHREASNETFFSHSMTSDCVVGSIAQYAHRFAHLFHSVSQTIYFNYPTYTRQVQIALPLLQQPNARHVNLLPLLTELRPDIPVLFEHTGAGWRREHAKHPWSWILWSHFVVLVSNDMRTYVANDLRTLLRITNMK